MSLEKIKKIIYHPLFIAGTIILSLHIFNITRYDFIADKDSYAWILKYTDYLKNNSLYFYRQLFSSLIFALYYLTGLDLYGIFKYLFPFFAMSTLLPLWLVARNLNDRKFQTLILLASAISPTVIVQFEGTRPQIMAMLYLYFMLGLSMVAFKKKNYAWLFEIFIPVTAIGSLFHRVFVIFLVLWVVVAAYIYRKIIYKNKIKAIVLLGLLYPWLDKLEMKSMVVIIFKAISDIFKKIFLNFSVNPAFPAFYVNVDGKQMGWGSLMGVLKYYAFYTGPFLGVVILLCLYFFITSSKIRTIVKNNLNIEYFLPIYIFLAFFLFIAEFLPRFGNIAYLPDRAWIFLGILLIFLLFKLFSVIEKDVALIRKNVVFSLLTLGFVISLSGAVFMNDRFKYIAPKYKLDSFNWIKENLEPNRVIFYYGWQNLLRYHSNTPVIGIKKDSVSKENLPALIKILEFKDATTIGYENLNGQIGEIGANFAELQNAAVKNNLDRAALLDSIKQMRIKTSQLFSALNVNPILSTNNIAYIYYAKDSEKNPYRERMWETGYSAQAPEENYSVLDDNPKYFKKVYDTGDVKIWRYIHQ